MNTEGRYVVFRGLRVGLLSKMVLVAKKTLQLPTYLNEVVTTIVVFTFQLFFKKKLSHEM